MDGEFSKSGQIKKTQKWQNHEGRMCFGHMHRIGMKRLSSLHISIWGKKSFSLISTAIITLYAGPITTLCWEQQHSSRFTNKK